ncbi:cytokine-dependent hematopoietic cell linker [Protopterus annectens]|uniref:cytokine-dependent hematopoietic cell linker n=1 Tax=Protopterus annectens TaxID=7888 RepID=UPI001CFAF609|nr:cytokine-dependent hematopoietic cell linker [Protopterus annectens]
MKNYEWYSGIHTRDTAEQALLREQIDGSFVVRDSSIKSSETPYVLVIFYADKVYNIKIRYLEDIHQYALGSGLRGDDGYQHTGSYRFIVPNYHKTRRAGLFPTFCLSFWSHALQPGHMCN